MERAVNELIPLNQFITTGSSALAVSTHIETVREDDRFIVIDRNYFEVPESEIDDIQVLETWVAGRKAYSAGDAQ